MQVNYHPNMNNFISHKIIRNSLYKGHTSQQFITVSEGQAWSFLIMVYVTCFLYMILYYLISINTLL